VSFQPLSHTELSHTELSLPLTLSHTSVFYIISATTSKETLEKASEASNIKKEILSLQRKLAKETHKHSLLADAYQARIKALNAQLQTADHPQFSGAGGSGSGQQPPAQPTTPALKNTPAIASKIGPKSRLKLKYKTILAEHQSMMSHYQPVKGPNQDTLPPQYQSKSIQLHSQPISPFSRQTFSRRSFSRRLLLASTFSRDDFSRRLLLASTSRVNFFSRRLLLATTSRDVLATTSRVDFFSLRLLASTFTSVDFSRRALISWLFLN
jgi:hypothetical protein